MGKIGNYEGPSIHKILRNLAKLQPLMNGSNMQPYFTTFQAFKEVAEAIFSTNEIPSDWRRKLHHLKECVLQLHTSFGMNNTLTLQILIVHVEQWVDVFGQSLGREGEQQGEALHHIWKQLLESQGQPKVKESQAFVNSIMRALLMFDANNV